MRLVGPLLACSALSFAALAAPTNEAPTRRDAPPAGVSAMGTPAGTQGGAGHSDARTIDQLVDMQQPSAGIQFNERAPRGSADSRARTAAQRAPAPMPPQSARQDQDQIDMPVTPPSGLFGSGATPQVQSRNMNVMDTGSSTRDAGTARAEGRPSSDVPPEVKRWLMWPRQVIEYVRENRAVVAGGIAMLLLMAWTGSMMFSRHRG